MNNLIKRRSNHINEKPEMISHLNDIDANEINNKFKYYGYEEREKLAFKIIDEALERNKEYKNTEIDGETSRKILKLWGLDF